MRVKTIKPYTHFLFIAFVLTAVNVQAKSKFNSYPVNPGVYIVQLQSPTLVARAGGAFTRQNSQILLNTIANEHSAVILDINRLLQRQVAVLADLKVTFNGLVMRLSEAEAAKLKQLNSISEIRQDILYPMDTDVGPGFIGAVDIWDGTGVPGGMGTLGEGVLIGVLDTGVNHDHPSFSATPSDGYTYINPNGDGVFIGWCDPGHPNFVADFCNNKLIGAWDFADLISGAESDGPEDGNGHGTHTASTSAGNALDGSEVPAPSPARVPMSGVAPHASIITYDICAPGGCSGAAILASIDQATLDGVDVINFSISGGADPWEDADRSFLDAIATGIFVAASAGNTTAAVLTTVGNVNHRGPWMMSVAASTHDRTPPGDVLATFSLRGPNTDFDVLKPDITAPGVSIYAAFAIPEYSPLSGTSMSSPHTAGSAILMSAIHPTWTPAEIKSAIMMTSAETTLKEDGITPADPDDIGAGRVELRNAGLAGLIMDIAIADYMAADPALGGSPRDLNLPSLTDRSCDGSCSWTRTVKSSVNTSVNWSVSATGPVGIIITAVPSNFTLAAGASQVIVITATISSTTLNQVEFARVAITDDANQLPDNHWPVALGGFYGTIPNQFTQVVSSDAGMVTVESLASGPLPITALNSSIGGMVQQSVGNFSLLVDPTNGDAFDNLADVFVVNITVPVGARHLLATITASASPDLDMFMGLDTNANGPEASEIQCTSATGTSFERCDIVNPQAGDWWVVIQNWAASLNPPDDGVVSYAVIDDSDASNLMISAPMTVNAFTPFDVDLSWNNTLFNADNARWYGVLKLGTDAGNDNNVGQVPLNFISDILFSDSFEN